jgi:hypothetical protein
MPKLNPGDVEVTKQVGWDAGAREQKWSHRSGGVGCRRYLRSQDCLASRALVRCTNVEGHCAITNLGTIWVDDIATFRNGGCRSRDVNKLGRA